MLVVAGGSWPLREAMAASAAMGPPELPEGALSASILEALPGKVPLIKKTWRPPNYETPISYFREVFTPNDAFYVRWHLANIPEVAAATWRLRIGGGGDTWRAATLGQDYGRFSFRPWTYTFTPSERGSVVVMAKATNRMGQTQTIELIANPAGYHHNVVQRVTLVVA